MITPATKHVYPGAILVFLAGISSFPVLAVEPTFVAEETSNPVTNGLIRRILEDPRRDYSSASGPDDCNNEALYIRTKELLGKYVANPMENREVLSDYILSSKEQCNCTGAIIGKDFDILLKDLGSDISQVPCL